MKKQIITFVAILFLSGCPSIPKPLPLPPTPPVPTTQQTLPAEQIGKKHATIDNGLGVIFNLADYNKAAAQFVKDAMKSVAPTNVEIPKQADVILDNSDKQKVIVETLKKENAELKSSALTGASIIDQLKADGAYMRELYNQTKEVYAINVKNITEAKEADLKALEKKLTDEKERVIEENKKIEMAKTAAAVDHAKIVDAENKELKIRNDGLQKFLESTLGKVFIPFIAFGAVILAAGIGCFFGLFEIAGRKPMALVMTGATMVVSGIILPIVTNSAARALDPTVTLILKIVLWVGFAGLMVWVCWMVWEYIKSVKTKKELVQTAAEYKKAADAVGAVTVQGFSVDDVKSRIMTIQSESTKAEVKRIRHAIKDKIDTTFKKDIPDWAMGLIVLIFILVNAGLVWVGFMVA